MPTPLLTTVTYGLFVCVCKNWKLLFKNIYEKYVWVKNVLKYVKYYLKTENNCLKTQIKCRLKLSSSCFSFVVVVVWLTTSKLS